MPESVRKSLVICVYAGLILSTLLVYWQARNFDFVNYDDNDYVYENQHVLNGLSWDGIIWAFTTPVSNHWHPLTCLSLMLNCQLFGPDPGWMHLTNVLLHLANTLLLFTVLRKMTGSLWPSAFVAAAFALHPMHVESVAWITERKDVLSTLFFLLTLAAYSSYVRRPTTVRYVGALAFFALGLMAKAMLVTVPFILLLIDYWPLNRFGPQPAKTSGQQKRDPAHIHDGRAILYRVTMEKIPFFVLSVASSAIAFLTQKAGGAVIDTSIVPFMGKVANALLSYAVYMGKMFWPRNLAPFYPLDVGAIQPWHCVLYALLLVGVSIAVLCSWRTRKYLPVGWFWFLGMPVPVIGLVLVGGCAYADRYTYIPYIGLFMIIAWGLPELLSRWRYRGYVLAASAVIALTAMGMQAHKQVSYWSDSIALFTHAIEVTRDNYIAYYNRGAAYYDLGRPQEAIEDYGHAIRIRPNYSNAYYNRGIAYQYLGRDAEAIDAYKQAIRINPDYSEACYNLAGVLSRQGKFDEAIVYCQKALQMDPTMPGAQLDMGLLLLEKRRYSEAVQNFTEAIRLAPDMAQAYVGLGRGLSQTGKPQEGLAAFRKAVEIDPNLAVAHRDLAGALAAEGDFQGAADQYAISLTIKPDLVAWNNLGDAQLQMKQYGEAEKSFRQAMTFNADDAVVRYNLAMALAELGQKQEALEEVRKSLAIDPNYKDAKEFLKSLGQM